MRKMRTLGIMAALFSLTSVAHADGIGQCVSACQAQCTTQPCRNACEVSCNHDITAPQRVFVGPVTSTPLLCQDAQAPGADAQCGFFVSGTVADPAFCPGTVTIYEICPDEGGTSIIAFGNVNSDCTFNFNAPPGPGQNGCYGLIAVAPATGGPDPGWETCTGATCPEP